MDHSGIQAGDTHLPIGCLIFQELEPLLETVVPVIRIVTGRSLIHTTAKDPVKIDVSNCAKVFAKDLLAI